MEGFVEHDEREDWEPYPAGPVIAVNRYYSPVVRLEAYLGNICSSESSLQPKSPEIP
jgi:hypothetical protein